MCKFRVVGKFGEVPGGEGGGLRGEKHFFGGPCVGPGLLHKGFFQKGFQKSGFVSLVDFFSKRPGGGGRGGGRIPPRGAPGGPSPRPVLHLGLLDWGDSFFQKGRAPAFHAQVGRASLRGHQKGGLGFVSPVGGGGRGGGGKNLFASIGWDGHGTKPEIFSFLGPPGGPVKRSRGANFSLEGDWAKKKRGDRSSRGCSKTPLRGGGGGKK